MPNSASHFSPFWRNLGTKTLAFGTPLAAAEPKMVSKIAQMALKNVRQDSTLNFCHGSPNQLASNITFETSLGSIVVDLG